MRDKEADLDARIAAAGIIGGIAWSRYIEPEENFGKKDFYEGNELHKPALKYFPGLVRVIADDEPNDPTGRLDQAAGAALAGFGDPYEQDLITDKATFYKAVNKLLANKHNSGTRTAGMKLIANNMPLEDFHLVADMVVLATRGTDPSYTVYRGGSQTTELGVKLLDRLNIQEAVDVLLDSFPTATRAKERGRRIGLLLAFGANAKPYLPRLRAALEKDLNPDPNAEEGGGFTKDVSLNKTEIERAIAQIEQSSISRKMISLEEAIAAGQK